MVHSEINYCYLKYLRKNKRIDKRRRFYFNRLNTNEPDKLTTGSSQLHSNSRLFSHFHSCKPEICQMGQSATGRQDMEVNSLLKYSKDYNKCELPELSNFGGSESK